MPSSGKINNMRKEVYCASNAGREMKVDKSYGIEHDQAIFLVQISKILVTQVEFCFGTELSDKVCHLPTSPLSCFTEMHSTWLTRINGFHVFNLSNAGL